MKKPQYLQITRDVYEQIQQSIGSGGAEQGGILGGNKKDFIVRKFYLDHTANQTAATYSPDVDTVNQLLRDHWRPAKTALLGFVHSHPPTAKGLSSGDLAYAQQLLQVLPKLPYLLLPIVISKADSNAFQIYPYAVIRNGQSVRVIDLVLDIIGPSQGFRNLFRLTPGKRSWFAVSLLMTIIAIYVMGKRKAKSIM